MVAFGASAVFIISIHAPTKGATYNNMITNYQSKDFNPRSHEGSDFNFSQKSISIFSKNHKFFFFITKYFLSYLFFFQKIALFVHISECESPYNFMPTSHSRFCIVTKSESRLLQFHGRHLYALLLSDTYFPNNKISNYQRSHQ